MIYLISYSQILADHMHSHYINIYIIMHGSELNFII